MSLKKSDLDYYFPDFDFRYPKFVRGKKFSQTTFEPEFLIKMVEIIGIKGFEGCKVIGVKANKKDNTVTLILDDPLWGRPKVKGKPLVHKIFNYSEEDSNILRRVILNRQKKYDSIVAKHKKQGIIK